MPLIRSVVILGHVLEVVLPQMLLVVSQACDWPLWAHSSHKCCLRRAKY